MLLRQTLLYLPAQFFGPLFQFIAAVVWTHQMDEASYGLVTYLIAAQDLAFLFGLGWWSAYGLRFPAELAARFGSALRRQDLAFVCFGSLFQIAVAFPILWVVSVEVTPTLFYLTALFLVTRSALAHYAEICRAEKAIGTYTVGQMASPVLGTALSFWALSYYGPDPCAVLGSLAFAQGLALIVVLRRLGVDGLPIMPDRDLLRNALRYCAPLMAAGIPSWIAGNGIRLTVDAMAGPVALGLLSAGWGIGQRIASVAATLVTAAAYPLAVERLEAGDRTEALRQVSFNGILIFGVLAPMAVGTMLISRQLVDLVIAEPFRATTVMIFPIAAMAGALRNFSVHGVNQSFLLLLRTDLILIMNTVDASLTIVLCALGLWFFGIEGAAIGCMIASFLGLSASLVAASRLSVPIFPGMLLRILLATGIMGCSLALVPWPQGVFGLVLIVVSGGLIYTSALLVLFPPLLGQLRGGLGRMRPSARS